MLFLELDLAIFERLTGAPLDDKGRPKMGPDNLPVNRCIPGPPKMNGELQPSWGIRIPQLKAPFDTYHGLTSNDPMAYRMFEKGFSPSSFRQVPVFDENIENRKWSDVWPCVTFSLQDFYHQTATSSYGSYGSEFDPKSDPAEIRNSSGEVVASGRQNKLISPHPESWDVTYAIRVFSKSKIELELITSQLLTKMFPGRSAIEVGFMNGTKHWCDMFWIWSQNLDLRGENVKKSLDPSEQAHYSRAFFYKIESYMDNTGDKFGYGEQYSKPVILGRIMELAKLRDGNLVDGIEYDIEDAEQPAT